jgi:hypothetical protein
MELSDESVEVKDADARRETLEDHGVSEEEIDFLLSGRRVELNAMTSRQLVDFIEEKLEENGVEKLVPDDETLVAHARRLHEQRLTRKVLEEVQDEIQRKAAAIDLPDDLEEQVRELLIDSPELSWDQALAQIIS